MTDKNPFDAIPVDDAAASVNPFDQINDVDPEPVTSSATGALARGAVRGAVPAAGGLAGAAAGARTGALAGAFIPGLGETGLGEIGGAIIGGLIGGFGGGWGAEKAQDYAISKLPDSWRDPLEAQEQADIQQHPYASFMGGLLPIAMTMSPYAAASKLPANATALQRIMANPATGRLFGGALQGGIELGQEAVTGDYDWRKVAISTGFGLMFNNPNALGRRIADFGEAPVNRLFGKTAAKDFGPTLAETHDAKVAGPGVTEEVFQGTHEQDPQSVQIAQQNARDEAAALGAEEAPQPDLNAIARRMEPELFARYDELSERRDAFRRWIGEANNPPDAEIEALQKQKAELEAQLAETKNKDEQRRIRTRIRVDVQGEINRLLARREAFARGEAEETADTAMARQHLAATDEEMRDLLPQVAAARRRAADAAGAETVAPEPIPSEMVAEVPAATPEAQAQSEAPARAGQSASAMQPPQLIPEPVKPIAEQKAFVASDVARQLIAAGRPRDEAEAAGKLLAARYETRAALFRGALGTAEDLYRREGARIIGPGKKTPSAAPASSSTPIPNKATARAPESTPRNASDIYNGFVDGRGGMLPLRSNLGGFNDDYSRLGAPVRPKARQDWQPGNVVNVGFVKDVVIASRDEKGAFTLVGKPDKDGISQSYTLKPHEGIKKGDRVDFIEAVKPVMAELAPTEKELFQISAYHGTPHDFDRFDMSKIGTGEGAQVYSHGLYFAGADKTAKYYRDILSSKKNSLFINDTEYPLSDNPYLEAEVYRLKNVAPKGSETVSDAALDRPIEDFKENLAQGEDSLFQPLNEKSRAQIQEAIAALEAMRGQKVKFSAPGKLYTVSLDVEPHDLLDWDRPLSEQSDKVKAALRSEKIASAIEEHREFLGEELRNDVQRRTFDEFRDPTGEAIYHVIADDPAEASRMLREAGIPGLRYLDSMSRGASEGSHNYVIYDDSLIKITHKDGEPVTAQERADIVREMYQRQRNQGARGSIRFRGNDPRAIIRLMADANASTFIHESGHDFLEQIKRDAAHEAAPEALKKDWETVKSYLGAPDGELKTKHHEKFARSFEQYMREGVAPSKELAGVFARFRDWLLNIYRAIKGLGKPINDDIRGVFDRMLAEEPQRTVIAPDVERGRSLSDIHEDDAATTPPIQADPAMARVEAEAERHETALHLEVQNELAPAIAEATGAKQREAGTNAEPADRTGAAEAGSVGHGGEKSEPVADRGAGGERLVEKLGSRSGARPEGGGLSGGTEGRPVSGENAGNGVPTPKPATTFGPDESPLVDKAGNIRIDNLTTREDVARAIREAAERNDDFIGDRRGVISDGQVMELADALGMDAEMLSKRKLGQAFNAEQVMAARKLLLQSATNISDLMKKAASGTDEDVMAYAAAKDRHQMIQAQVAGLTAEAGRALRAFHSIVGDENAVAVDRFIKKATGKTLFQMREEAKLGAQLQTPQQVSRFMYDAERHSFGAQVLEYWINGLISGPATHTTYMVGNLLLALQKAGPETWIAAGLGAARRAMGREGPTVRAGEVGAQVRAARAGFAPALKASAEAFRTGMTTLLPGEDAFNQATLPFQPGSQFGQAASYDAAASYHDAMESSFAIARGIRDGFISGAALLRAGGVQGEPTWGLRYSPLGAIPDVTFKGVGVAPVGTLIRGPGRFIAAIHSLFRSMNYSMEKAALAYRQAAEEGLEGMQLAERAGELYTNPTDEIMEQSVHEATELTLMGKGAEFTAALSRLTNAKVFGFQLAKFIDPFVRISSNVIGQSLIQRTPIGILSPELRADLLGKNGAIAADRAAARMLAGTALCVGFGTFAAQGLVSGSGPKDPKQAAMWRLAGNQAHSVRIGDTWYDLHRLGPLGMLMGMSADLYDVIHKADEGKGEEAAAHLLHAVTQNILDESFMRGPAELIQAIEDPDRHGQAYIQNFLSSFVPYAVGMSQIARATDPWTRQAHSVIDAIKRKVPGLSEELMPRRDIWGEPMPSADALIEPGVTAIYERHVSADPVNLAMLRLGVAPAQVGRTIRNVELTDQERDDFIRIAGRMAKMRLDKIVQSPMFANWPAHVQHDVITETIKQSREAARGMMMMKYPRILRDATENRLKKIRGEDIEEIE